MKRHQWSWTISRQDVDGRKIRSFSSKCLTSLAFQLSIKFHLTAVLVSYSSSFQAPTTSPSDQECHSYIWNFTAFSLYSSSEFLPLLSQNFSPFQRNSHAFWETWKYSSTGREVCRCTLWIHVEKRNPGETNLPSAQSLCFSCDEIFIDLSFAWFCRRYLNFSFFLREARKMLPVRKVENEHPILWNFEITENMVLLSIKIKSRVRN